MPAPAWILFVESNTSGTGALFVAAARALGYQPVLLTCDPQRYPFVVSGDVPVRVVDTSQPEALHEVAAALAHDRRIAAVLSTSEYFLVAAATLARAYQLPGPDPVAVRRARDKSAQRDAFRRAGLRVPVSHPVACADQACQTATRIGLPVVVKPVDGTGSIGVRLCRRLDHVARQATMLLARRRDERGLPTAEHVLVEQYLAGCEYSAELFGDTLVGITRKHLSAPPYFVEIGHDYPARLSPALRASVADQTGRALRALGLGWGPAHIEFRLAAGGPTIIEVNARLAGGLIPELIRAAQNVDLITQTLRVATGEVPDLTPTRAESASIRFVTGTRNGQITAVTGREAALRQPGVFDVQMYRTVGERLQRQHDFRDRIGHVMACAPTLQEAARAARRARDCVRVCIEPDRPVRPETSAHFRRNR